MSEDASNEEKVKSGSLEMPRKELTPSAAEVLDEMPSEVKQLITSQLSMQLGRAPRGPDALAAKIPEDKAYDALKMIVESQAETNKQHLEAQFNDEERKDNQAQIRFYVAIAAISGLGLVLCWFAWKAFESGNTPMASHLLTAVVSLLAGGLGGYGVGKKRSDQG